MKIRLTLLLSMTIFCIVLAQSAPVQHQSDANERTIAVTEAGTLRNIAPRTTLGGVDRLVVTGTLNGSDILYLRELCGTNSEGDTTDDGIITSLDLAGASIVAGGDAYYEYWDSYYTENDIVGTNMFAACHVLKKLVLPRGITEIGESAFDGATSLESVTIGNAVTSIGELAFNETALKTITLPESVTTLGDMAFYNCKELEAALLSDNIEAIGFGTFYFCTSLRSVNIPAAATEIGLNAFHNCTSLQRLDIPAAMTEINEEAFGFCDSLKEFKVSASNSAYSDVDGVLFNKAGTALQLYPIGKDATEYTLPEQTTAIMANAFLNSRLQTVTMGDAVTAVGNGAFWDNKNLTAIRLSSNLEALSEGMFFGCSNLKSIEIPVSVSEIGQQAFMTTGLEAITFPVGLAVIPSECCYSCEELKTVSIPESVTTLKEYSFYGCKKLETINCYGAVPPECEVYGDAPNIFTGVDMETCVLNVPQGAEEAYRNAPVWKLFTNIRGAQVTVTGIDTEIYETARYNASGILLSAPAKGLNIVVYSDGSVKKISVK